MTGRPSSLLPELDLVDTADQRMRVQYRKSLRKRARAGFHHIAASVHKEELAYLMGEWGFESYSQLIRVSLKFLEAHTRAGLTHLTVRDDVLQKHHNDDG